MEEEDGPNAKDVGDGIGASTPCIIMALESKNGGLKEWLPTINGDIKKVTTSCQNRSSLRDLRCK